MNVMEVLMAVIFALILKEALNVLVEMATCWMVTKDIVQVPIQSMYFNIVLYY